MRAHLVQYDIAWEDPQANFAKIDALLSGAGIAPGDLVLLPEMFDTGFSINIETTADRTGASRSYLAELARRFRVYVQGGISLTEEDGRGRNRALIFSPDGAEIARFDKIHPFSFGSEPEQFSGGDSITTYTWGHGSDALEVGPAICYDLRFPELFRAALDLGAQVFAIGANWPSQRQFHWRTLLIARAIENQAFVLATNRIGSDPTLRYVGGSTIVDPQGAVLAEAGDEETVVSAEIDPPALHDWRARFPAWRDRRPDLGSATAQKAAKSG